MGRALTGDVLTEQGYQRIFSSREAALRWHELPEARIELGGVLYFLSQAGDEYEFDEAAVLRQAREELERGLARAPVDPDAWLWLSDVRFALDDPAGAAAALRLSLILSPLEPGLGQLRASQALRLWDRLRPDAREIAARDMAGTLASRGAADLVREADRSGNLELLRTVVAGDEEASRRLAELTAGLTPYQ